MMHSLQHALLQPSSSKAMPASHASHASHASQPRQPLRDLHVAAAPGRGGHVGVSEPAGRGISACHAMPHMSALLCSGITGAERAGQRVLPAQAASSMLRTSFARRNPLPLRMPAGQDYGGSP